MTGVLHLGSGGVVSTRTCAETIIEVLGSNSVLGFMDVNDYVANIEMDTTKARRLLGWQPRIGVSEGLREVIREQG